MFILIAKDVEKLKKEAGSGFEAATTVFVPFASLSTNVRTHYRVPTHIPSHGSIVTHG